MSHAPRCILAHQDVFALLWIRIKTALIQNVLVHQMHLVHQDAPHCYGLIIQIKAVLIRYSKMSQNQHFITTHDWTVIQCVKQCFI